MNQVQVQQWQVQSNIEAFGYYEAARMLKRKRMVFEAAYFLIFGKMPRKG